MSWNDLRVAAPMLWIALAVLGLLLRPRRIADRGWRGGFVLALGGLSFSFVHLAWLWQTGGEPEAVSALLMGDRYGLFLSGVVLVSAAVALVLGLDDLDRRRRRRPEFEILLLLATLGALVALQTHHLLVMIVGLELFGVCALALTGFFRSRTLAVEAAMKSFLMASFGTALLLFGTALIFGAGGSFDLTQFELGVVSDAPEGTPLATLGIGFLMAGLAIVLGAVPFHFWLPDVFEGAPVSIAAFRGVIGSMLGAALLGRVFLELPDGVTENARELLWWLAVVTAGVGSLGALAQRDLRRLLGFLTLAHIGHLLIAIASTRPGVQTIGSISALLALVLGQAVALFGAFAILGGFEAKLGRPVRLGDLSRLGRDSKFGALAFSVFLAAIVGFPGTAGFVGRLLEVKSAIAASRQGGDESFMLLAILGILCGVVGIYVALMVISRFVISLFAAVSKDAAGEATAGATGPATNQDGTSGPVVVVVATLLLLMALLFGSGTGVLGIGVESALSLVEKAASSF